MPGLLPIPVSDGVSRGVTPRSGVLHPARVHSSRVPGRGLCGFCLPPPPPPAPLASKRGRGKPAPARALPRPRSMVLGSRLPPHTRPCALPGQTSLWSLHRECFPVALNLPFACARGLPSPGLDSLCPLSLEMSLFLKSRLSPFLRHRSVSTSSTKFSLTSFWKRSPSAPSSRVVWVD